MNNSNKLTPLSYYRPEIDGLRALAVMAVIIFHLNNYWLTGGFLGVDIFFVISGYLITSIIANKFQTNSFSFKDFYTRRIKRIYPIFVVVLFLASLFATLFFVRSESELLRKAIENAVLFTSNFYIGHRLGYWDMQTVENPLVHIWSLAVEEQYYLLFPLFLLWAYKKTKKPQKIFTYTLILFLVLVAGTFLPNDIYTKIKVDKYYISNLRFPELLVGSLLALSNFKITAKINSYISYFACIGLLICLFWFNKDLPFLPGITMLIPCSLTALLIASMNNDCGIKRLFSIKPVVFIGKISYSLYLFHWLFIACTNYITGQKVLTTPQAIGIFGATFFISVLSYYAIETPLRHSKFNFKQTFIYLYLLPSLFLVGFNLIAKPLIIVKREQQLLTYEPHPDFISTQPAKIALIGDSHSEHLMNGFMQVVGNHEGWKADLIKFPYNFCYLKNSADKPTACNNLEDKLNGYPVVVISMFYNLYRNITPVPREEYVRKRYVSPNFNENFARLLKDLSKNHKVIVLGDVKSISRSAVRTLIFKSYGLDKYLSTPITEMGNMEQHNLEVKALVEKIPNVIFIDPSKYLPMLAFDQGKALRIDQDHLSSHGSILMGKNFIQHQRLLSEKEVKNLYK